MPLDWVVERADKIFLLHERIYARRLVERDEVRLHVEIAAARVGLPKPVEAVIGAGQHQATGNVHAARLAGDRLDFFIGHLEK